MHDGPGLDERREDDGCPPEADVAVQVGLPASVDTAPIASAIPAWLSASFASVHAADHLAEVLRAVPQGTLRVSAPVSWGAHRLVPVIGDYMTAHSKVKVELSLNDRVVDLAEEGFDCGVRSGTLTDDRLIARPLRRARMLAAGSQLCALVSQPFAASFKRRSSASRSPIEISRPRGTGW